MVPIRDFAFPCFALDSGLRYVACSEPYLDLIRLTGASAIGRRFGDVHPHGQASPILGALERFLAQDQAQTFTDYCPSRDGWFDFCIARRGDLIHVLLVDVTDRVRSTLTAQSDAEMLRGSFNGAVVGMARVGLDGRWLDVNSACLKILGRDPSEGPPKFFWEAMPAASRAPDQQAMIELVQGQSEELRSQRQIAQMNGALVWVELRISLVRSADGKPLFFIVALDDVSKRKHAEESLRFALEASQTADWDFDAIKDETRRSERFDGLFGHRAPVASWGFADFLRHIHPDDREAAAGTFRESLANGRDWIAECRIIWPDASVRWLSFRARVYRNEEGRAVRMAGLALDVTERRLSEAELRSARQAAEDASQEKSFFLANMSHEIRTPLGAILGFAALLEEPTLSTEDHARYLRVVNRNGEGLAKLIDEILDLSKVEAGHMELEDSPIVVRELLEDVVGLLQVQADDKGLGLEIHCADSTLARIQGDRIRLRQVLLNVVGNAIKFTARGKVSIAVETSADLLTISVRDSGVGLSDSARARLFQPFMQADSSTSRTFGGTGLGLALSRRLASAMGGDLVLQESRLGEGSTFVLTVPARVPVDESLQALAVRAERLSPPVAALDRAASPSLNGVRVLLAEDSPDNQLLIQRLLGRKGAELDVATDGIMALDKASRDEYDVVLMDMQMPKLDGYEATRRLRRGGYRKPIIALTAHAMRHDRAKCIDAGCSAYLSKPIDATQLYRLVAEAAASRR